MKIHCVRHALLTTGTLLLLARAALAGTPVSGQTIDGILLERGTERGVDLGLVTLFEVDGDSVMSVLTDADGRFRVTSPAPGDFLLGASALGYRSVVANSVFTLPEGGSMTLEFRLEAVPVEIGGITVEAESSMVREPRLIGNGFVQRAQQGFGRFLTPHDIEKSMATDVADLLARTGRVLTRYGPGGQQILMRGQVGYCSPIVYLDGFRQSIRGMPLEALVRVSSLEAVEVYRTATEAPVRYGGGMAGCGVIVLWTKVRG